MKSGNLRSCCLAIMCPNNLQQRHLLATAWSLLMVQFAQYAGQKQTKELYTMKLKGHNIKFQLVEYFNGLLENLYGPLGMDIAFIQRSTLTLFNHTLIFYFCILAIYTLKCLICRRKETWRINALLCFTDMITLRFLITSRWTHVYLYIWWPRLSS